MKNKKLKLGIIGALVGVVALTTAVIADPGTESDPLISKSYIDDVLMPQIEKLVDSKVAGLGGSGGSSADSAGKFVVVEASKGDEIICAAGTEVILRMGKATLIATEKGGLADTTIGEDLPDGTQMPPNHLLIVPVADGRGLRADTDIIVMIKGGYTVK